MNRHKALGLFIVGAMFLVPLSSSSGSRPQKRDWETICPAKTPPTLEPEVPFLQDAPIIDGRLDDSLAALPVRLFETTWKEKSVPLVPIHYRLAYGTGFFYVYVEADAEHLTFRDRAFQNGDGFVLLLAKPRPNGESADEFYELACSAVDKPTLEWTRRIFWNYNVNSLFVLTSPETKLEFGEGNGKIRFELLLPWDDVRPYHPWISEGIGFNLTFCKAIEPDGQMWFTMVGEDRSGREFTKHPYTVLKFQTPSIQNQPQTFVSFRQGHITAGQPLNAVAATVAGRAATIGLRLHPLPDDGQPPLGEQVYAAAPGLTKREFVVATSRLAPGDYSLAWDSGSGQAINRSGLTILPEFDPAALNSRLSYLKSRLSNGTYETTQFMIEDLHSRLAAKKPYETSPRERSALSDLSRILDAAAAGFDPLSTKSGFTRKAHRSKIDGTLQPYLAYLPDGYDPKKKYPLMVFLHGSASDEMNLEGWSSLIPDGFVAVGPLGRGKSNGYARDHAQDDIAEVIEAAEADYAIDSSRILLAGFSMGGYGVYRTCFETPGRYRALAVFCGGPGMGLRYAPQSQPPDFSDEKNLAAFRNMPIFIFHGEKDLNAPFPATRALAEKLVRAGASVEARFAADKGHENPGPQILDLYRKWVDRVMR
jgi:predicted esterase